MFIGETLPVLHHVQSLLKIQDMRSRKAAKALVILKKIQVGSAGCASQLEHEHAKTNSNLMETMKASKTLN